LFFQVSNFIGIPDSQIEPHTLVYYSTITCATAIF